MAVSYVFLALFLVIIGYLIRFVYVDGDNYRNNAYNNKRLALLEDKYARGDIVAADGTVLATTNVEEDGTEKRVYPLSEVFAHVVGYRYNGVTGLESLAGSYLLDSHENPALRIIESLRGIKTRGDTVHTTLDVGLQQAAYNALDGRSGAIVVMEPATGKVLAMVSEPDFDPNTLEDDWDWLVDEESNNSNLVNRATQGLYAPGSTFKVLTTLEFMREYPGSWQKFSFDCDSAYESGDEIIRCSHGIAHGEENITEAFAQSCNGAFANIGEQLSFAKFHTLCQEAGFNRKTASRVPMAASQFVLDNNNSEWKVLQTAIGQGETQMTPFLNCMIAAAVANDGKMMNPYLIESVLSRYGDKVASFGPETMTELMSKEEAAQIGAMMRAVVTDGTGDEAAGDGYKAYGKTGSAEINKDSDTHAWFIGYAEDDNDPSRKIAVSVIVEQGGSGGSVAAPLAKKVFRAYFGE